MNNEYINNPYFDESNRFTRYGPDDYIDAKICLPLHTGIFQNDKIFPNMLMGQGLQVSLLLEDNRRVFRTMDGANINRRPQLNPLYQSIDGSTTAVWNASNGSATDTFYVSPHNSQISVENFPFVIGERIGMRRLPYAVSNEVEFRNATGNTVVPHITGISYESGSGIEITLSEAVYPHTTALEPFNSTQGQADLTVLFSKSNEPSTLGGGGSYEVKNSELILQQISVPGQYEMEMMNKMKSGGKITYDFLSTTNYKYSQLVGDVVANVRLPINNARCKSIVGIPTDATQYSMLQILNASDTYKISQESANNEDITLRQQRVGLEGISDNLTDYQFRQSPYTSEYPSILTRKIQ
jgi:hypothetical protein